MMTNRTISISKLPGVVGVAVAACVGVAACGKADPGMSGTGGTGLAARSATHLRPSRSRRVGSWTLRSGLRRLGLRPSSANLRSS